MNATLYNCQPGFREPNWSHFVRLSIGGCIDRDGETTAFASAEKAEFFTIYGIDADGFAEAISDFDSLVLAREHGATLAEKSSLPLVEHPSLAPR